MRKISLIAALSVFALPAVADDAALLLGVERYQEMRRVPNATDVLDSAQNLRRAGYEVTTLSNGTSANMTRLLNRFAQAATEADRLVVGLSGRFVTDGTRSWLLATDSQSPTYFGLSDAVSIDSVLAVLEQAPGQAVLILGYDLDGEDRIGDYLREGVGALNIPQGVTVLYGEPNATDGVVMEAITVPGVDVMEFARDARWLNVAGFAPRTLVMQPDDADGGSSQPSRDPTQQFWIIAQQVNTADAYRDFALNYPRSPYAREARERLDAIENDPVRIAEAAEDNLSLTRNARREIQRHLTLLDYNTRGVGGIFGTGSRRAIRNWQQSNGFAQTSYLTAEQINRIDAQASRKAAEIADEQERERAEAERLDRAYWEETGARGDDVGYRAYLNRYPDGIFADEARDAMAADDRETEDNTHNNQAAADVESGLRINAVLARLIESRLEQMGFNPGRVDGRFDSDTRSAISRYQTRSGLPATGYLSEPTLARLLADTFGR